MDPPRWGHNIIDLSTKDTFWGPKSCIVLIHFEPPRRRQPLYIGHKAESILSTMHPLLGGFTPLIVFWQTPMFINRELVDQGVCVWKEDSWFYASNIPCNLCPVCPSDVQWLGLNLITCFALGWFCWVQLIVVSIHSTCIRYSFVSWSFYHPIIVSDISHPICNCTVVFYLR